MKVSSFSPSSIGSFVICPAKWKFSQEKALRIATPDEKRRFGETVHLCIQKFYKKISDRPTVDEIEKIATECFESEEYNFKGSKTRMRKVLGVFINFEKKRLKSWRQYKPTLVEKKLEAKLFEDLPVFRVIVDAYWKSDEIGLDWKTGSNLMEYGLSSMSESNLRQGKINLMVLEKNGFPVKKFVFFNLNDGTNLCTPRVSSGWIYKISKRMYDMVLAERFPSKPSGLCPWCEYQISCQCSDVCLWDGV